MLYQCITTAPCSRVPEFPVSLFFRAQQRQSKAQCTRALRPDQSAYGWNLAQALTSWENLGRLSNLSSSSLTCKLQLVLHEWDDFHNMLSTRPGPLPSFSKPLLLVVGNGCHFYWNYDLLLPLSFSHWNHIPTEQPRSWGPLLIASLPCCGPLSQIPHHSAPPTCRILTQPVPSLLTGITSPATGYHML